MANYYASARSNYFSVKNEEDLRKLCDLFSMVIFEGRYEDNKGKYAIAPDGDSGGWGDVFYYGEYDEDENLEELLSELSFLSNLGIKNLPSTQSELEQLEEEIDLDCDDFLTALRRLIPKDEILILMEAGAEQLRYVGGYATAINGNNDYLKVELQDIYQKIKDEWNVTDADFTECGH